MPVVLAVTAETAGQILAPTVVPGGIRAAHVPFEGFDGAMTFGTRESVITVYD